jgi:hypothetical protein
VDQGEWNCGTRGLVTIIFTAEDFFLWRVIIISRGAKLTFFVNQNDPIL